MFEFALSLYLSVAIATFLFTTVVGPMLTWIVGKERLDFRMGRDLLSLYAAVFLSIFWPVSGVVGYRLAYERAKREEKKYMEWLEYKAKNMYLFEEEIAEVNSDLS